MKDPPAPASGPAGPVAPRHLRAAFLALAVGAVVFGGVWVGRAVTADPRIAFLGPHAGGWWIVYPHTPRAGIRPVVDLDARFIRSFDLASVPSEATLTVRAFRSGEVRVNGAAVLQRDPDTTRWKRARSMDVSELLRVGENRIVADVYNDKGFPALWLRLVAGETAVATDRSWEVSLAGATPQHAARASDPVDLSRAYPGTAELAPVASFRARLGSLAWMVVVAMGGLLAIGSIARAVTRRPAAERPGLERMIALGAFGIVALAWALLFLNNLPSHSSLDGFDAEGHLEYIQFLLDHGQLPWADQGWSMFQPPLYYLLSAGLLKLAGSGTFDPGAAGILLLEGLVLGIAQLGFLLAGLRLVFPGRPASQAVAFVVVAFLPVQIYQFHFVGNDALLGTLCAAAIFLGLRMMRQDDAPWGHDVLLGALLGCTLLAKFSGLVVMGVLVAVLASARWLRGRRPGRIIGGVAATVVAAFATCGWYFAPVWRRFGRVFVGNWDPDVLPAWWQDPGHLTVSFYTSFGRSFVAPVMSAYHSFADGIYTTLWGDGLLGGRSQVWFAPPWNHDLMMAGYLWAVIPSVLVVIGVAVGIGRLYREPRGAGFAVGGIALAMGAAMALWPLKLPIYSVVKAGFGLPAVIGLGVLAALGWEALPARRVGVRWVVLVALGVWAINSYATFWTHGEVGEERARLAWIHSAVAGHEAIAEVHAAAALAADPDNTVARLARARLWRRSGRSTEAKSLLRQVIEDRPDNERAHVDLARILLGEGRQDEAMAHYERVVELRSDHAEAHLELGKHWNARERFRAAEEHLREALRVAPDLGEAQYHLGVALLALGEEAEAVRRLRAAVRLSPGEPAFAAKLAWALAADPEAER